MFFDILGFENMKSKERNYFLKWARVKLEIVLKMNLFFFEILRDSDN